MSNGMPYAKWHGRDWIGDPLLRMVGPEARGVWIDLLCVMMESDPYGHLAVNKRPMTDEEAARMIGMDVVTYKGILYRLEEAGIPSRTESGMLYSRRLVRDYKKFIAGREAGVKGGGNPRLKQKNTETRTKKPEAKGGIKDTYIGVSIPAELAQDTVFASTWENWKTSRMAKGKAPKDWNVMFQAQLDWLVKFGSRTATEILNQSIRNGWQGLFEIKKPSSVLQPTSGLINTWHSDNPDNAMRKAF